jgi:hypothetical protein
MNASLPPPNRGQDTMSPVSVGSEWSGVNIYNTSRSDTSYTNFENPISPMSEGNLPRQNGFGPPPFDGHGRRRPSEAGSRHSSRAPSIAPSRSSDGTISDQQSRKYRRMESELAQHYTVLRAYLRGGNAHPPRPNKARDKLLRLSPIQFHELSTDVFDELQRRQALAPVNGRPPPPRDRVPPFLQPRQDFHEKRNQARQKLSSLQTPRFRDLSTDVFCELERRFPQFARPDGRPQSRGGPRGPNGPARTHSSNPSISSNAGGFPPRGQSADDYGRPMQRQFQSNTITPNKSTMIEDEDELAGVDSRYERSSDAFGLESALTSPRSDRDTSATSQSLGSKTGQFQMASLEAEISDLKEQLRSKDDQLQQAQSNAEQRELQQDLEEKLRSAEQLNQNLQAQLDRIHHDHASVERELRTELESAKQTSEQSRVAPDVVRENEELREQLKEQDDIIEDVRKQAKLYLDEMRTMAEAGGGNFDREEKLQSDVHRLEEELKEWKAKYVRTKTQLRGMRASSLGLSISRTDVLQHARDGVLYDQAGIVKDVHVTRFQIAIDELLRVARQDPSGVLEHMKTVVIAVRSITTDIEGSTPALKDEETLKKHAKMKSKVSATANNVITASKNYAAAGGLSPVSLLDAAASHLTAAVVDLVRTVKIKPTPPGELEDNDEGTLEPVQGNGYFNIADSLRRRSAVDSIYSAISTPDDANGAIRPGSSSHRRTTSSYKNGNGLNGISSGLGIKPEMGLGQEDADLEDLKVSATRARPKRSQLTFNRSISRTSQIS